MNDTGSLLYVPFQNSVDILDVSHGILSRRVTLSEARTYASYKVVPLRNVIAGGGVDASDGSR